MTLCRAHAAAAGASGASGSPPRSSEASEDAALAVRTRVTRSDARLTTRWMLLIFFSELRFFSVPSPSPSAASK